MRFLTGLKEGRRKPFTFRRGLRCPVAFLHKSLYIFCTVQNGEVSDYPSDYHTLMNVLLRVNCKINFLQVLYTVINEKDIYLNSQTTGSLLHYNIARSEKKCLINI